MEPVDSRPLGEALPPPRTHATVTSSPAPSVETKAAARRRVDAVAVPSVLPMLPWRVAGAIALSIAFGLIGWEIRGVVDDQPWSDPVMYWSIVAGIVAGRLRARLDLVVGGERPSPGRARVGP